MAIGANGTISSADLTGQSTGTKTVSKPTGTQNSDVLILVWANFENGFTNTLNTPTGWTQLYNFTTTNIRLWVYWALGSVSSLGFTFTGTGGSDLGWTCVGFTGVDNTTPIDATGTSGTSTGSTSVTAGGVTVATAGAWELIANGDALDGPFSATGFTAKDNGSTLNQRCGLLYNTTPKGTGGTGTVLCSNGASATSQELLVAPFALRPAASADVLMAQSCL